MMRTVRHMCFVFLACSCAIACGDEDLQESTSTATGGSGGGTSTSHGGSTSTGGAGGEGAGCGEVEEAPQLPCLPASAFADVATIEWAELCAVARYEAPVAIGFDAQTLFTTQPAWGRHGGPVMAVPAPNGAASVVRLLAPASTEMTSTSTSLPVDVPDGSYLGSPVVDAPFLDGTALAWSAPFGEPGGEVVLARGSEVEQRYATAGVFGMTALGTCDTGRVLHTGLSMLGDDAPGDAALYAADSCGAAGTERLTPQGDPTCSYPQRIAAWGDAAGPVAADAAGNVAAVMTTLDASFASVNHARIFSRGAIGRGSSATEGTNLFELDGFGWSLAMVAPRDPEPGIVLFQPMDSTTAAPLDVVGQRFLVNGIDAAADGAPSTAVRVQGREAAMFRDGAGRIWLAVATGAASSTMLVLERSH